MSTGRCSYWRVFFRRSQHIFRLIDCVMMHFISSIRRINFSEAGNLVPNVCKGASKFLTYVRNDN